MTAQSMRALERAQSVRLPRAVLRGAVEALPQGAGFRRVADLLEDPPEIIETLAIAELLKWINRVNSSRARSILTYADELGGPIFENRRVGELTERQRYVIADFLYEKCGATR